MQDLELQLVGDIYVQCNSDIDCPIGLICKKNSCRKPGPVSIHIIKGIHTEFSKNLSYFWQISLVLEKYLFDLTYTDFQTCCQKEPKSEPKSELKSDFQKSISKSKFIQIFLVLLLVKNNSL